VDADADDVIAQLRRELDSGVDRVASVQVAVRSLVPIFKSPRRPKSFRAYNLSSKISSKYHP
jgi:hypothetical protein